jgi:hypothetical protein
MTYFDVDPKPEKFVHPNGVAGIKSVSFGTKKEYFPLIRELCDDPILKLFVGEGVRDVEYERVSYANSEEYIIGSCEKNPLSYIVSNIITILENREARQRTVRGRAVPIRERMKGCFHDRKRHILERYRQHRAMRKPWRRGPAPRGFRGYLRCRIRESQDSVGVRRPGPRVPRHGGGGFGGGGNGTLRPGARGRSERETMLLFGSYDWGDGHGCARGGSHGKGGGSAFGER